MMREQVKIEGERACTRKKPVREREREIDRLAAVE